MYRIYAPFNDIDNNELYSTIQAKNKNKKLQHIPTERLHDMMNQSEFNNLSAFYYYKKLNEIFNPNICNGTNILHMNINSLSYLFMTFTCYYHNYQ